MLDEIICSIPYSSRKNGISHFFIEPTGEYDKSGGEINWGGKVGYIRISIVQKYHTYKIKAENVIIEELSEPDGSGYIQIDREEVASELNNFLDKRFR